MNQEMDMTAQTSLELSHLVCHPCFRCLKLFKSTAGQTNLERFGKISLILTLHMKNFDSDLKASIVHSFISKQFVFYSKSNF